MKFLASRDGEEEAGVRTSEKRSLLELNALADIRRRDIVALIRVDEIFRIEALITS